MCVVSGIWYQYLAVFGQSSNCNPESIHPSFLFWFSLAAAAHVSACSRLSWLHEAGSQPSSLSLLPCVSSSSVQMNMLLSFRDKQDPDDCPCPADIQDLLHHFHYRLTAHCGKPHTHTHTHPVVTHTHTVVTHTHTVVTHTHTHCGNPHTHTHTHTVHLFSCFLITTCISAPIHHRQFLGCVSLLDNNSLTLILKKKPNY